MKHCKGNCGKQMGLMQGDYCEECLKRQPIHIQLEKELDKMEKDLRNIRGGVCRIQNEMNEIIESRTRRF